MMVKPPPHYTLNNNRYESKAKGVSISASILSVIVYVSVFYFFDLSPSIVFNSSKFWFFLSNTLIIIIAADYGSFLSSNDGVDDPYDKYVAESRQPMSTIYHQPYYIKTTIPLATLPLNNTLHEEDGVVEKNMIFSTSVERLDVVDDTWSVPTQDSIWKSIYNEVDDKVQKENLYNSQIINHFDEDDKKKVTKFRRTLSEKLAKPTQVIHEKKNVIHRCESERYEPLVSDGEKEQEQEDATASEFTMMTDEELNRRVEEFIQKFNRHIRLERNINF